MRGAEPRLRGRVCRPEVGVCRRVGTAAATAAGTTCVECARRCNGAMARASQGPRAPIKDLRFHSGLLGGC